MPGKGCVGLSTEQLKTMASEGEVEISLGTAEIPIIGEREIVTMLKVGEGVSNIRVTTEDDGGDD